MGYKRKKRKAKTSRAFYKKHKSKIINDFLDLCAKELKEVEEKMIKQVLAEGTGQRKTILFGFMELQVRPDRFGGIIVEREINKKAFKKAILKKLEEINGKETYER